MNSAEEKRYFEAFAELNQRLLNGRVIKYNEKESWPDVIYETHDNNIIVIELTELLTKKNIEKTEERRQEELEEKLNSEIIRLINESLVTKKIEISITLDHRQPLIIQSEIKSISDVIVRNIKDRMKLKQNHEYERIRISSNDLKAHKVDNIEIYYSENIYQITSNTGSTGSLINPVEIGEIKRIIKTKDKKIIKLDEFEPNEPWLVIVETEKASTQRIDVGFLTNSQFQTDYKKVFIYKYFSNMIFELTSN